MSARRRKLFSMALPLLLVASGCVQVSQAPMPRDWPALQPATPSQLSGDFTGTPVALSRSASVFFPSNELYADLRNKITALHLTADTEMLTVRVKGTDGRTLERAVPIGWDRGAAVVTRRHSGREGGNAATYRDTWRLTTNSAGELVFEQTSFTTGRLGIMPGVTYEREWWRLQPEPTQTDGP